MSTRWKIPRKVCPVEGCVEPVRVDRLMCAPHWRTVDRKLRRALWGAVRAWKADSRNVDRMREIRNAQVACVADANEKG